MAHEHGELATARAAAATGVMQGISSFASFGISEVVGAGREVRERKKKEGGSWRWEPGHVIQMYPMRDRALQERILRRAEEAGCLAVFVTGDSPVLGVRYNEWKNDFRTPEGIGFPVMEAASEDIRTASHDDKFKGMNDDGARDRWTSHRETL